MAEPADTPAKSSCCKILCYPVNTLKKIFTPPRPNQESVLYWYIPVAGAASYMAFSVHVFNPNSLARIFPSSKHAVANCLLFNAHLGTGLYLFSRKHLAKSPLYNRIMFSVYGALIFNFGSVLLWAVTKVILPERNCLRFIFAISSSLCMLFIGKDYISYVDRNMSIKEI